jgi:polyphenol oxidase
VIGSLALEETGRPLRIPEDDRAVAAFGNRDDGLPGDGNVSLVVGTGRPQIARAVLTGSVGLDPGDAVFMEQVHGAGVAVVGAAHRGRGAVRHSDAIPGVDALVTRDEDVALVVMVADCVPLVLVDPGVSVAAVHAGRRGVELGVVGAALEAMRPDDPAAVWAAVGPAIGGCCYEVPDALADEVGALVPQAAARTSWGTRSLDLPAGVEAQLRAHGVRKIARAAVCTRCGPGRWFSHRAAPGEGRQAAVVSRRSRPLGEAASARPGADSARRSLDWAP